MQKPFVILFAGAAGTGKTPIAHYLSWKLNLPIFSNDSIRLEVIEDILEEIDVEIYLKRRDERLKELLSSHKSFIFDASIDRNWPEVEEKLKEKGYDYFIISLDISEQLLKKAYKAKNYTFYKKSKQSLKEHQDFIRENKKEVQVSINDINFLDRLKIVLDAVNKFIEER